MDEINYWQSVQLKLQKAQEYHKKNEFNKEKNIYIELLENEKEYVSTNVYKIKLYLGLVNYELGDIIEAIKNLNDSINEKITFEAYYNLGIVYTKIEEFLKGLDSFERALELDSKNIKVLFNIGIISDKIGKFEKAIKCFQEIITYNPDCIEARQRLAYTFSKIQDKERAVKEYNICLDQNIDYCTKAMILNNLGTVLLDLGKQDEAIETYKIAIKNVEKIENDGIKSSSSSSTMKDLIENNLNSEIGREKILEYILPGSICVEIGVFRGNYSRRIRTKNPGMLYLIDPWIISPQIGWKVNENVTNDYITSDDMEDFYKNLKEEYMNDETVKIMRTTSMNAAMMLGDTFRADFVYIDGGRRVEDILSDLFVWYSKLNDNGVLCGRDYNVKLGKGHVIYAVDTFVKVMGAELTVIGNQYIIKKT